MPDEENEQPPRHFWADKSATERALIAGVAGVPEIRAAERKHYLGELEERVLAALTRDEVASSNVSQRVAKAMADPRAKALIIRGDLPFPDTAKYRQLAGQHGLALTIRNDPSLEGEVGLVVVSDQAVK